MKKNYTLIYPSLDTIMEKLLNLTLLIAVELEPFWPYFFILLNIDRLKVTIIVTLNCPLFTSTF
jgi:hypothetical protein